MDFLEYSDISAEIKGCMTRGKLKMTDTQIIFKNNKTGKAEHIAASDFDLVNLQNFAGTWGLRIFLKNGILHRFVGFKDADREKIARFFSASYKIQLSEKEVSMKGWNWGTAKFTGSVLSFDVSSTTAFEIPLNYVSQCTAGKNEITMEFHQNDEAPVSLMEMRLYLPPIEMPGDVDTVEAFQQNVMDKASVNSASGDAIATFREIHCLTPRGRYDIKIFNTFFQLHGKTFDYKISMTTVLRLFLLPHKDSRQTFFVISLGSPIKQGQTRYDFLVFLFRQEDETTVELPFTEDELKEKFEGKLEKELSGPTFKVMSHVMQHIIKRKINSPGNFVGHYGTPAISCSFKAAAGLLYPLERGFVYVHKPPIHIRFEEVVGVLFARGGGNTRSFDFEVELKSGAVFTFSSIEKEEYAKLFDFITTKKIHIKNRGGKNEKGYKEDFGDTDDEEEPDAYLERVKAEAQYRYSDDDVSDGDSTDDDFKPELLPDESEASEEFDTDYNSSSGGEADNKKSKIDEEPLKKPKRKKEDGKPKRASTAFMLWLNENREKIKNENGDVKVTEVARIGGEIWKKMEDKSEWEERAEKDKERYVKEMEEYKASAENGKCTKKKNKKSEPKVDARKIKSKEYIEDTDSSTEDERDNMKRKKDNVDDTKDGKKKTKRVDEKDKKDKRGNKEHNDKDGKEKSEEANESVKKNDEEIEKGEGKETDVEDVTDEQ